MVEIDKEQYSPDIVDKIAQYEHTFGALKTLSNFPPTDYPKIQLTTEATGQQVFWNDNLRWGTTHCGFALFNELCDLGLRSIAIQIRDKHKYGK